jgi:hypothetical protein
MSGSHLSATPRTTSGGYPWADGDILYADDLNAAFVPANGGGQITGSINVTGAITAGTSIAANGSITAGGGITASGTVSAGADVHANGNVTSGNNVAANGAITAGTSIAANGAITAGTSVTANGAITAGTSIAANGSITAGGGMSAAGGISAGTSIVANGNVQGSQVISQGDIAWGHGIRTDSILHADASVVVVQFANNYAIEYDNTAGQFDIILNGTVVTTLDFTARLVHNGTAFKPGGGTWSATSDDRTKRDVADYGASLAEIEQLRPISYSYNGEGGTIDDGVTYYGLSAQATQPIMPELVTEAPPTKDSLPGQLSTQLGPLTLALLNAVKELAVRVAVLEAA